MSEVGEMEADDLLPRKADDPLAALEREDLATHSLDELEERIKRLEREIARVATVMAEKSQSMAAAEAAFKSGS